MKTQHKVLGSCAGSAMDAGGRPVSKTKQGCHCHCTHAKQTHQVLIYFRPSSRRTRPSPSAMAAGPADPSCALYRSLRSAADLAHAPQLQSCLKSDECFQSHLKMYRRRLARELCHKIKESRTTDQRNAGSLRSTERARMTFEYTSDASRQLVHSCLLSRQQQLYTWRRVSVAWHGHPRTSAHQLHRGLHCPTHKLECYCADNSSLFGNSTVHTPLGNSFLEPAFVFAPAAARLCSRRHHTFARRGIDHVE